MASIQKRPNGQWRARYRDDDGREHARHFGRKVDAQRWLDEQKTRLLTGTHVDPKAGRTTVEAYAKRWQAVQVSSAGTRRIADNALRVHLYPALGSKPIGSVQRSTIQGFVRTLEAKGLAPGSVRNIYEVTAQVFLAAVDDKVIAATPCRRIKLPKAATAEVVPPTVEQVLALVEAIEPRFRALVVTLAGSGVRIGEALGLAVADVDFLRRTISVKRQRLQSGEMAPLKSASSRRVVPVGHVVIDELAAHLAVYPSEAALFTDELGRPLGYSRWKREWRAAAEAAKVSGSTAHSLRHFFASALISGGASVKQVQTVLGHSSAVITLRTYAHLWPGDDDRTRDVMDAALSNLADSVRTEGVVD